MDVTATAALISAITVAVSRIREVIRKREPEPEELEEARQNFKKVESGLAGNRKLATALEHYFKLAKAVATVPGVCDQARQYVEDDHAILTGKKTRAYHLGWRHVENCIRQLEEVATTVSSVTRGTMRFYDDGDAREIRNRVDAFRQNCAKGRAAYRSRTADSLGEHLEAAASEANELGNLLFETIEQRMLPVLQGIGK